MWVAGLWALALWTEVVWCFAFDVAAEAGTATRAAAGRTNARAAMRRVREVVTADAPWMREGDGAEGQADDSRGEE